MPRCGKTTKPGAVYSYLFEESSLGLRKQKQKLNGFSGGSVNANPSIIFKYF